MNEHPVTTLDLNAYLAGDVSDLERRKTADHLASCEPCRRKLASLEKERADFLAAYPFNEQQFPSPVSAEKKVFVFPAYRTLLALAATVIIIVSATTSFVFMQVGNQGFRSKGDTAALSLYVLGESGKPEQRTSGIYHPDERIQFTYSLSRAAHFILLSLDTSGASTVYYPESGDTAVLLAAGADIPLPNSIVLDTYTGPEIFLGIFIDNPALVQELSDKLSDEYRTTRSFETLPAACGKAIVRSFIIEKKSKDTP